MDTIESMRAELAEISKQLVESQLREAELLRRNLDSEQLQVRISDAVKLELINSRVSISGVQEDNAGPALSVGVVPKDSGDREFHNMVSERNSDAGLDGGSLGRPFWQKNYEPLESAELKAWKRNTSKQLSESKNPKFKGKHWEHWKTGVLSSLNLAGLKELVLEDNLSVPADAGREEQVRFEFGSELVFQFLHGLLSDQQSDVSGCVTAREIWKKLEDTYQNRSLRNWMIIYNGWTKHSQGSVQTMESYIREQESFVERLKALGREYDDPQKSMQLLAGLHSRFAAQRDLYTALEKPYEELVSILKSVGIQTQAASGSGGSKTPHSHLTQKKKEVKKEKPEYCYNCGDGGHTPGACPLEILKTPDGLIISRCYNCKDPGHSMRDCPKARQPRKLTPPK